MSSTIYKDGYYYLSGDGATNQSSSGLPIIEMPYNASTIFLVSIMSIAFRNMVEVFFFFFNKFPQVGRNIVESRIFFLFSFFLRMVLRGINFNRCFVRFPLSRI